MKRSYLSSKIASNAVELIQQGRSLVLVGERRSGLTVVVDAILDTLEGLNEIAGNASPPVADPPDTDAPFVHGPRFIVVKLDARVVRSGRGGIEDIVSACISASSLRLESDPSIGTSIDYSQASKQLKDIASKKGMPLICIDHFEALVSRFDEQAWIYLKNLVEHRSLQLLALSRLTLTEVETIAKGNSKLSTMITDQFVLAPVRDIAQCRELVEIGWENAGAGQMREEFLEEIVRLGGGWRSLTQTLAGMVAHFAEGTGAERTLEIVDQAIAENREELRREVTNMARWLDPQQEPDPALRKELEREQALAFKVLMAPAGLINPGDPYLKRLESLGHLIPAQGDIPESFSTPLISSLLRLRWYQLRKDRSKIDHSYIDWCDYDEKLRGLLRERLGESLSIFLASSGITTTNTVCRRVQLWWGQELEEDALEGLECDLLQPLLATAGVVDSKWIENHSDAMTTVAESRKTMLSAPIRPWSSNQKTRIKAALSILRDGLPNIVVKPNSSVVPLVSAKGNRRQIRWLHISDLHFAAEPKARENLVLSSFLKAVRRDAELAETRRLGPAPDLVLFTGDLAFSGQVTEYKRAAAFFDELLSILKLGRERLFLVPGNHDVCREKTEYLERSFSSETQIHSAFRNDRWRKLYSERLACYFAFIESFFENVPGRKTLPAEAVLQIHEIRIRNISVAVHLINDEWCGGLDDDKNHLVLGLSVLHDEFVAAGRKRADLELALMHHPEEYLVPSERVLFKKIIGENVDMFLHGHLHKGEVSRIVSTNGNLLQLAAGALFQGDGYENTAQFAEVDIDTRQYTVYPISYAPDRNDWVRDTRLGEHPNYMPTGTLPDS